MTVGNVIKKIGGISIISAIATSKLGVQMAFAQDASSVASYGGFLKPTGVSVRGGLASSDKLGSGLLSFLSNGPGQFKIGSENTGLYAGASLYGGNDQWDWRLATETFKGGQSGRGAAVGPDILLVEADSNISYSDVTFDIGKTFATGGLKARLYLGGTYGSHKSINIFTAGDFNGGASDENIIATVKGLGGHVGAAVDYQVAPNFSVFGGLEYAAITNASLTESKIGESETDTFDEDFNVLTWDFGVGYQMTPMSNVQAGVTGKTIDIDAPFDFDKLQAYYIGLNVKF